MKNSWQKKALVDGMRKFLKNNKYVLAIIPIVVLLSIIYYLRFKTFNYIEFDLVEISPLPRIFLSAIGFYTIGAFLYYTKFYLYLFKICRFLHDLEIYNKIKAIIWLLVIGIVWICVQFIIDVFNTFIELIYNLFAFSFFLI